jgi:hypothetical protein
MTYLFAAILSVEGWRGPGTFGAHGERGPYQITLAYWRDAKMPDGTLADCEDAAYAQRVMVAYWRRYCPLALRDRDYRVLAAVHHHGWRGKKMTEYGDDYVERVMNQLKGAK